MSKEEDLSSPQPLYRSAIRAALLGLGINLALAIVKLLGGIIGRSFALVADAVNSLGDTLTSLVTLAALWYAQQPPDDEHPYGHTRAEAVAGAYVAILILGSALVIAWEVLSRVATEHELPAIWTLWIAGTNVVIKEALYWYKRNVGKRTGSTAMIANAWDHRSDALCSSAVLAGLTVVRVAGPDYAWVDEAAAMVVVAAILWSGGRLLTSSTSELLDPQADAEVVHQVREAAEAVPGVQAVEKLWVRKTGIEYLVDAHIQVDAEMTVEEGHRIGHLVKDQLVARFARIRDVLVHLEPFGHDDAPNHSDNDRNKSDDTSTASFEHSRLPINPPS
jgi:cation diffusion facilitator family transporter